MKIWYRAVCDTHKEMCHVLVSNPTCSAHYLGEYDKEIQKWLKDHSNCSLRLIHQEEDENPLLGVYSDFLTVNDIVFDEPKLVFFKTKEKSHEM